RIARDLHDTLAQGFAGIAFQLEAVATRLTETPAQVRQHLNLALQMVRHSMAEARRSVMNLRSAALDNGDLGSALADTARQMMADKPVDVQLKISGSVQPIPAKVENDLLRIEDNGRGFDPATFAATDGVHFGLLGMRERAKQMGARLSIQSRPGQG